MAFIDLVSWDSSSSNEFAWKYPETNLTTFTQLLVHESQEAVLLSKGQIVGKFGPGKHTLDTVNLPLLKNLYGIPFGKKNPFTAEVWFVNKRIPLNLDWSISKVNVDDPKFGPAPIVASGRYGLRVVDAERFIVNLVGTMSSFTADQLTDHFQGQMEQNTKAAIVNYIRNNRISVVEIGAALNEIANAIQEQMKPFWANYGFELPGFYITNIDIDESTEAGRKIVEAMGSRAAQNIAGYTWQQEQAMKVAGSAAIGGGDMGILGMAMLAGSLGGGNGAFANNLMQPPGAVAQTPPPYGQPQNIPPYGQPQTPYGQPQAPYGQAQQPQRGRQTVFCSHCGKSYPVTSRFCPHCGNPYRPCPVCGADNSENARRCVSCGSVLPRTQAEVARDAGLACPKCGTAVAPGTKFCPNCGSKL